MAQVVFGRSLEDCQQYAILVYHLVKRDPVHKRVLVGHSTEGKICLGDEYLENIRTMGVLRELMTSCLIPDIKRAAG